MDDKEVEQGDLEKNNVGKFDVIPDIPEVDADALPNTPNRKAKAVLEQLEMMVMNQSNPGSGIELSKLGVEQQNKIIDLMHKNEDNAFIYANKSLEVNSELRKSEINASIVGQKTARYVFFSLIAAIFILLILILFFKDEYFGTFLSFIMGLFGGAAIRDGFVHFGSNHKQNKEDVD